MSLSLNPETTARTSRADTVATTARQVGVIGGGQLAQMMAAAAPGLGLTLMAQTPSAEDPAASHAHGLVLGPLAAPDSVRELARQCEVITCENELVDLQTMAELAGEGVLFRPGLAALKALVDKRRQRELLDSLDVASPAWIGLKEALRKPARLAALGFPLMAKRCRGGYDGRGTEYIPNRVALEALAMGVDPGEWYLEALVPFERELAVVAARSSRGEVRCYPLMETHQHQRVCHWVQCPAPVPHPVEARARTIIASLLESLDYVGVLAMELFLAPQGLLVNEMAPRTHNSGHLTIEAAGTSQFAQHLRAVSGLPLGPVQLTAPGALMVNLLGFESHCGDYRPLREAIADLPGAHLHWYGKAEARPGRKMGHVTFLFSGASTESRQRELRQRLAVLEQIWPRPGGGP